MAPPLAHPYTVDVRPRPGRHGVFQWSIRQWRRSTQRSSADYATFEDARIAMKVRLDQLILDWQIG